MSIRVVTGEIEAKDATTRVVLPVGTQPHWPPFERVAETIATPRRPFPPHHHAGVEVLTYVIEGFGSYAFGADPLRELAPGSVLLLTARSPQSHAINPAKGHTVRWFAAVATIAAGTNDPDRLQSGRSEAKRGAAEGTIVRRLVGPGTSIPSVAGLEGKTIEFQSTATSFQRVGHDRVAVCYALGGQGRLDNETLEGGEAAFVQDAAGVALQGQPGFRVVFLSAPQVAKPSA
ncbi:MAG: hypothetical protein WB809_02440 [Thermoplasmata archaeon]